MAGVIRDRKETEVTDTNEPDDLNQNAELVQRDDLSTSGFQSDTESIFSSEGEDICPDDSDHDPDFIPPTDTGSDISDTDTVSKQAKAVPQDAVTVIPESEESEDSIVFPALTQNPNLKATLPAQSAEEDIPIVVQSAADKKCWFCVFCEHPQKRLPRHLLTMHADEDSVIEYSTCKDKKLKSALLCKIRNLGNHLHNTSVLKKGKGVMIVAHRPTQCEKDSHESYLPCPECYGYFRRSLLYRHTCPLACVDTKVRGARVRKGECLLPKQTQNPRFSEFQSSLRSGVVSTLAKTDRLIIKYGEDEFDKNGHDPDMHNYIRTKVRTVAKVLLEVRKVVGSPVSLADCMSPDKYEAFVEATKRLAGFSEGKQEFDKPSLARNVGMYIKKCALIYQSLCLQKLDNDGEARALQLIKLIELTWNHNISHHALRTLRKRKMNSPSLLPVTSDIVLVSNHLQDKAKRCADTVEAGTNTSTLNENWRDLNIVTLAMIIMFNRRRQGEVSKMKLTDFTLNTITHHDEELAKNTFSTLEQALCKKLRRIEIPGKRGRTVPILLTSAMKHCLEVLVSSRKKVGINPDNLYLFPRMNFGSLGHLRGSDCLRDEVAESDVKSEVITSTKIRKQIATISQVANLRDHKLDVLADFLGHDVRIHREFYRLPQATYQMAKISKLLLAVERGDMTAIHGRTLDEITVSADDVLDDEEDVACEEPASLPRAVTSEQPVERPSQVLALQPSVLQPSRGTTLCAVGGDNSDSDEQLCSSSYAFHAHPKRRKTKANTARKPWTSEEKKAVEQHFAKFLLNCKLPGKAEIEAVQEQSRVLANRKWTNIKDFIRNKLK